MKSEKILVLLTSHNRKDKTKQALKKINDTNTNLNINFLIVDDGSTDGTIEELNKLKQINKKILRGDGNLYYSGGMRRGMEYLINNNIKYDYLLLINDDVSFFDHFLEKMVEYSKEKSSVIIGATIDDNMKLSYGGIKYKNHFSAKHKRVGPEYKEECDTFNANCVLIPYNYFLECGAMDKHYIHSIGDFDYGLKLKKRGFKLYVFDEYVGICNRNSIANTWQDTNLSIRDRLKKKREIKGEPTKQIFYYFNKNFNFLLAIKCSIVPYIKIFIKK